MKAHSLAALLLSIASMPPANAAEAMPGDSYEQLYALLNSAEYAQLAIEAMLAEMRRQFAADPNIASFEEECPGTVDAMMAVSKRMLDEVVITGSSEFEANYVAVLRGNMPPEQATAAITFFRSDLGQRYLRSVASSIDLKNSMASSIQSQGQAVPREAYDKDTQEMARNALQRLSDSDAYEATLAIGSADWGKALIRIRPQLAALEFELLNAGSTPEEDAQLEQEYAEVLEGHLSECGIELADE